MAKDPVNRINPDEISKNQGIEGQRSTTQPDQKAFQSHMKPTGPETSGPKPEPGVTPMDLSKGNAVPSGGPTLASLLNQVTTTQESLTNIQKQLKTPKLKFKRQHQYLIKNKLSDANDHLRAAESKLGINDPNKKPPPGAGPLERFISLVSDGQNRLVQVKDSLKKMGESGQISPRDYMLIQIKLAAAQQEIEYTSVLLGKMVDTIKQTLNIQI